ncbi:AAA family ATPase [Chloroflexota bacterium]
MVSIEFYVLKPPTVKKSKYYLDIRAVYMANIYVRIRNMIPQKLSLTNFMCYRGILPPLDFSSFRIACLSGQNGSGKSAIIDAMTWALWGKTRAGSDDKLVSTGSRETAVDFEFLLGQRCFRVLRRRQLPKRVGGAAKPPVLEFQEFTDGNYKVLTGESVTQTQQFIIDTLHMDYDTFINSAFLRQGQADEFTNKRPGKRKEVLANILGFGYYEELEAKAKYKYNDLYRQRNIAEAELGHITSFIEKKRDFIEAEIAAQTSFSEVAGTHLKQQNHTNSIRQKQEIVNINISQLEETEGNLKQAEQSIIQWQKLAETSRFHLAEYQDILAEKEQINQGWSQYQTARNICTEYDNSQREHSKYTEVKTHLEKLVEQARNIYREKQRNIKWQIAEGLKASTNLVTLQKEHEALSKTHDIILNRETRNEKNIAAHQKLRADISSLGATIKHNEVEINNIIAKEGMLASGDSCHCPLCESELAEGGLKHISEHYAADKENLQLALKNSQKELELKISEAATIEKAILAENDNIRTQSDAHQRRAAAVEHALDVAEKAKIKVSELEVELASIEEILQKAVYATAEQAELNNVLAAIAGLDYDNEKHFAAKQAMQQTEEFVQKKQKLDAAEQQIIKETANAEQAREAITLQNQVIVGYKQRIQELTDSLVGTDSLKQQLADAEAMLTELDTEKAEASRKLFEAKKNLEDCARYENNKSTKLVEIGEIAALEDVYRELAEAFSKNGIQVLLIKLALPELENEANRLLAKMTDNRMHLKFETDREKKTGGTAQTLDIIIADELGTRDYEMFSGGEAFRINFAIRIALSRLLAGRAGAPLPTLIVDEGFGTQDNEGLEKIKEAINSIQDDFEKILVITHIDELRDVFPTRIDVVKKSGGSMYYVN